MTPRLQIVFQTPNPHRLGDLWRTALGYVPEPPPDGHDTWGRFVAETGTYVSQTDLDSAVHPYGRGPTLQFEIERPTSGNAFTFDIQRRQPRLHPRHGTPRNRTHRRRTPTSRSHPQRTVDTVDRFWIGVTDPDGNCFCIQHATAHCRRRLTDRCRPAPPLATT